MNILQISGYDLLGKQVNGYMLHEYFKERGYSSSMIVSVKHSNDNDVHALSGNWVSKINSITQKIQEKLSMHCMLPVLSLKMYQMSAYKAADIVNLQLLHNNHFFSLFNLPYLSKKKRVILSVHDMFMMTGHCVYSMDCDRWKIGCGTCPDLKLPFSIKRDKTKRNWRMKKWIFSRANLDLIVGSQWQLERVKSSPILSHLPVHYIPYGVNTRVYKVKDKAMCRERFKIPEDADVISFRSVQFLNNFKGTDHIERALLSYKPKKETYLLTFESVGGHSALRSRYKFIELGWVTDVETIAQGLNAADIFLMPSIAEAFGLMAVESMACGTPVIVFDGTALPKTINAPTCGISIKKGSSDALMHAIKDVLENTSYRQHLQRNALKHVEDNHTFETYAESYLNLYKKLLYESKI